MLIGGSVRGGLLVPGACTGIVFVVDDFIGPLVVTIFLTLLRFVEAEVIKTVPGPG